MAHPSHQAPGFKVSRKLEVGVLIDTLKRFFQRYESNIF